MSDERIVKPWPDSAGVFWCDHTNIEGPVQSHCINGEYCIRLYGFEEWSRQGEFISNLGPARFTKCEPNPFESTDA